MNIESNKDDESMFKMLNEVILSGQIPQEKVFSLVQSVPGFYNWRKSFQFNRNVNVS